MSNIIVSANIGLPIPIQGVDPGPDYANNVNASLIKIDAHNHTPGNGVAITPSAININSDLNFLANNAINLRSARFSAQGAPLSLPADLGCLYVSGVDLYFNDENGNQVRITQSGGVSGSPGSIANLTSPASATYVAGNSTFVWQSDANTAANMDFGSAILRNITAGSNGITISPPNALAANYTLQLPAALPASTVMLQVNPSGNISATNQIDGAGGPVLTQNAGNLVVSGGIQASSNFYGMLLGGASASVSVAKSDGTLPYATVVSANPSMQSLKIVRGRMDAAGTILAGEGFTCVNVSPGNYDVTFNQTFSDIPVAAVIIYANAGWSATYTASNGSLMQVTTYNPFLPGVANGGFSFIAIGQRDI